MKGYLMLGLVILLLLPLLGLWSGLAIEQAGQEATELLAQARQAQGLGQVPRAEKLVEQARQAWQRRERLAACLWDHRELEEITLDFWALEDLAQQQERQEFGRVCLELSQRIRCLCQEQWPLFDNIF